MSPSFRSQFRDKQEWSKSTSGCIELNTPSDEAAKAYDAVVTQLCGWYEDAQLGGIGGSLERMQKADSEFVLGRALALELSMMGGLTSPRLDSSLAASLADFNELVSKKAAQLSEQERLHAQVVNLWAGGQLKESTRVLERLATLFPEDLAAIKMNQDTYFFLGQSMAMRNCIGASLARMEQSKSRNPLKGYVHGMLAFALEESNQYGESEREALKALALIPHDTWAIHNYAHCLEMTARSAEGLKWMLEHESDWAPCATLACHQYWHTALFHVNNDQLDEAVALLDGQVVRRCVESGSSFNMHDAASMLYRMQLVDLFSKADLKAGRQAAAPDQQKARWSGVYEACKAHKSDHLLGFNDAHFLMSFLGMGDLQLAREFIDSIDQASNMDEAQTVVKPLLEAMYQFKVGEFAKCVRLLEPIRFEIVRIGGSHAQRDVFEQLLLVAALKSEDSQHNQLAQRMLNERDLFQGRRTVQTELLAQA